MPPSVDPFAGKELVTRKEFNIVTDKIHEDLRHLGERTAVLEATIRNLQNLPDTMAKLDKTMTVMGENLKNLNAQFKDFVSDKNLEDREQSTRISNIDGKSKVDFLEWIKHNWTTVVIGIATLSLMIKEYLH